MMSRKKSSKSDFEDDCSINSCGNIDMEQSTSSFGNAPMQEPRKEQIGAVENRRVIYSRLVVFMVLLGAAAAVGFAMYSVLSKREEETFKSDFNGLADEIIEVSQQGEKNLVLAMSEFATGITSTALTTEQTWPYVAIPDFERRAGASRALSEAYTLAVVVSIPGTDEDRNKYFDWMNSNMLWYYEACLITGREPGELRPFIAPFRRGRQDPTEEKGPVNGTEAMLVHSHYSPPPSKRSNYNLRENFESRFRTRWNYMSDTKRRSRSHVPPASVSASIEDEDIPDPVALFFQPIFKDFSPKQELVAFASVMLRWKDRFINLLHADANGIVVVLENTCNQTFTYEVNGPNATYVGEGDLHDEKFEQYGIVAGLTVPLDDILDDSLVTEEGNSCGYSITVYPSEVFRSKYDNGEPLYFTLAVLFVFAFTTFVFVMYDCLVQRRQNTVMDSAVRTDAIVSSLFPEQFREQMLASAAQNTAKQSRMDAFRSSENSSAKSNLKTFVSGGPAFEDDDDLYLSKPVADLFLDATVLFADIVGFTAWSSVREPSQVFTLLESIYRAFDKIAKRRQVYKVETVGDAYVAVAGVPTPTKNHAIVMARFARDCAMKLPQIVHRLERFLGPGTGDITMRFGLNSGPVTAGVLRGEKARFQLFGDTVNTASRIENTGRGNMVHLSEATANLLVEAGKSDWVHARSDIVHLKGKGDMKTFWLVSKASSRTGSLGDDVGVEATREDNWGKLTEHQRSDAQFSYQTQRLVEWNAESLLRLLQQIVANRKPSGKNESKGRSKLLPKNAPLDEVAEIIALPQFDSKTAGTERHDPETINLGTEVKKQLYSYITWVASAYKKNAFHNFEHASHVSMSVNKLLSRIVAPEISLKGDGDAKRLQAQKAAQLHDHTYGITSDPMTQFACALSALIHDADHRGVPNGQLVKEDPNLGVLYDQSVAEQNSVDIAWNKLMSDEYHDLRSCIYSNETELRRFRQVVVNTVLATDIFDKKLKELRNARWEKAFQERPAEVLKINDVNRKATIVIEHIIQASDVAHTMQHWHVYTKWNEKLFQEMYQAYVDGRSDKDPSTGWYGGELWFFDNYVIPLAKKLKDCGVFGVSSDEYLNYAMENRKEWAQKGKDIVAQMVKKCNKQVRDQPQEQALLPDLLVTQEIDGKFADC